MDEEGCVPFAAGNYRDGDKLLMIAAPFGEYGVIMVDTDDVDHNAVSYGTRKMLAILNEEWNKPKWAHLNGPPPPADSLSDEEAEAAWEAQYEEAKTVLKGLYRNA